jgi:hypothetical protein
MNSTTLEISVSKWTLSTFLGWMLGVILVILFSVVMESFGVEELQFHIGLAMGLGIGFAQWWTLRKFLISKQWIWYTAIGLSVPFIAMEILPTKLYNLKLPVCVTIGSVIIGILQSRLLKAQFIPANRWIASSVIGWTLAAITIYAMELVMLVRGQFPNLILALANLLLILAGGVVLGIITGVAFKKTAQ